MSEKKIVEAFENWFQSPFVIEHKSEKGRGIGVVIKLQFEKDKEIRTIKKELKKLFKKHNLGFWSVTFDVFFNYEFHVFHTFRHEEEVERYFAIIQDVVQPFISGETKRKVAIIRKKMENPVPKKSIVVKETHSIQETEELLEKIIKEIGLNSADVTFKVQEIERSTYEINFFFEVDERQKADIYHEAIDILIKTYQDLKQRTAHAGISYEERTRKLEKQKEMFRLFLDEQYDIVYEAFDLFGSITHSLPDWNKEKQLIKEDGIEMNVIKKDGVPAFEVLFEPEQLFHEGAEREFLETIIKTVKSLLKKEESIHTIVVPIQGSNNLKETKERAKRLLSENGYDKAIDSVKIEVEDDVVLVVTIDAAKLLNGEIERINKLLQDMVRPVERQPVYYIINEK